MGKNATVSAQVCSVCGAKSKDNKKLTFHGPSRHEPTKKKWAEALKHVVGKLSEDTLVCSKHFREVDYMMKSAPGGKPGEVNKVLKKIAVPVLHLRPQPEKAVETGKMPIKITIKKEKNKDTPKVTIKTEKPDKEVPKVKVKKEKEEPPKLLPKTIKKEKKDLKEAKKDPKESKVQKKQQEAIVVQPRHQSRRAASKEALKQMQILLDDEDDDTPVEIPDDDEEVVPVPVVSPPKKKYKLTHRKSADGNDREVLVLKSITPSITNHYVENNLELECWTEELEPCQKERITKLQDAEKEMQAALDQLIKAAKAEIVYKGDLVSAIEVKEQVQNTISTLQAAANQPAPSQQPSIVLNSAVTNMGNPSYQLVMDSRTGIIVGAVPAAQASPAAPQKQLGNIQVAQNLQQPAPSPPAPAGPRPRGRGRPRGGGQTHGASPGAPPPRILNQGAKRMPTLPPITPPVTRGRGAVSLSATPQAGASPAVTPSSVVNSRPSETNVEGGLAAGGARSKAPIVDLTGDDGRPLPDSREISFNKLQGKTFPSLVVVARPHLRVSDTNAERPKLDAKVKSVLMLAPTKFTEWLIQQGLVRSEQKCSLHGNTQLKLGMYSDVSKFPFSGGYVWISECCSQRFVSVFSGSLFEGSPHPPLVILKLLYHWACQTNIQNVTQWVKVDNLYVKGMFTWLRSVCTSAIHTHFRPIGGPNKKVEVGVISLGTTSQDGNSRQVKVEVLGVLEADTKLIRLRAVEPLLDNDRNYKRRFTKILEPLAQWVNPASIIVTDLTVDKITLHQMGFVNVIQATSSESACSNRTVMEYLRRIVPRMFQNTLSLLSRQIIQQFLDELVWREWFGTTPLMAFDNLVTHLAEQTRVDTNSKLIARLNRIALNPFKNWAVNSANATTTSLTPTPTTTTSKPMENLLVTKKRKRKEMETTAKVVQNTNVESRPPKSNSPDVPEQMVPLENYYYGTIDHYPQKASIVLNMKCPFCKEHINNNIVLMNHLFQHAHNVSKDGQLCRYCLTSAPTANDLLKHIASSHPCETKFDNGFVCLICEMHYMNPFVLGRHMSREHQPSELPYQCGTCGYRCSNHKQAIDHFYLQHDNGPTIQCPFCLKSTTVFSSSRNIVQNMNYFIQHLQKHQRKQFARRCGKCNLWFVQKEALKEHQTRAHASQRGKSGLVPWNAPRNGVMVPKSKMDRYPGDADVINFAALFFSVPKHLVCRECGTAMDSPKHFPSFESCQNPNCQYSTCCSNAMQEHNAKCSKNSTPLPSKEPLPYEMFCVCSYSSTDGNQMARHLAICERKSAYPSKTEAASASVTHSMLDVLGLVRKPDEKENKTSSETKPEPVMVEDVELSELEAPKSVESTLLTEEKQEPVEIVEEDIEADNLKDDTSKDRREDVISVETDVLQDKVSAEAQEKPSEEDMEKTTEEQIESREASTEKDLDVSEENTTEDYVSEKDTNAEVDHVDDKDKTTDETCINITEKPPENEDKPDENEDSVSIDAEKIEEGPNTDDTNETNTNIDDKNEDSTKATPTEDEDIEMTEETTEKIESNTETDIQREEEEPISSLTPLVEERALSLNEGIDISGTDDVTPESDEKNDNVSEVSEAPEENEVAPPVDDVIPNKDDELLNVNNVPEVNDISSQADVIPEMSDQVSSVLGESDILPATKTSEVGGDASFVTDIIPEISGVPTGNDDPTMSGVVSSKDDVISMKSDDVSEIRDAMVPSADFPEETPMETD